MEKRRGKGEKGGEGRKESAIAVPRSLVCACFFCLFVCVWVSVLSLRG